MKINPITPIYKSTLPMERLYKASKDSKRFYTAIEMYQMKVSRWMKLKEINAHSLCIENEERLIKKWYFRIPEEKRTDIKYVLN